MEAARTEGLPARLAAQILDWAQSQGLSTGAHLREQTLADTFKVSRTPVRLALNLLRDANAVEQRPNRGFFLREPTGVLPQGAEGRGPVVDDPVYLRIAEDRLAGTLAERVTEVELQRRYAVTSARLRRILARMTDEGWIDRLPGRGWIFQPVLTSTAAYEQAYRYRLLIEPAALLEPGYVVDAEAFARVRSQQLAMLDGGIERFPDSETFRIGAEFHETLVACSGNVFMLEGLRRVNRLRRLMDYRAHRDRRRLPHECRDHLTMLDMIEDGRMGQASDLLRVHLAKVSVLKARLVDVVDFQES